MQSPPLSRAAFLLAGGKSSRMGENKAFIDFRGQTLLEHALAALSETARNVTIVGDPEIFARHGRVISDIFPGCGPLAGIHAALTHSSAELNLMLAVDMPFVSSGLVSFLIEAATERTATVVVPRTQRGLQPLCAVYRRDFASVAEQAIRTGIFKIDAAFAGVSVEVIEETELAAAGFLERAFFNVNTPDDRRTAGEV